MLWKDFYGMLWYFWRWDASLMCLHRINQHILWLFFAHLPLAHSVFSLWNFCFHGIWWNLTLSVFMFWMILFIAAHWERAARRPIHEHITSEYFFDPNKSLCFEMSFFWFSTIFSPGFSRISSARDAIKWKLARS